VVNLKTGSPSLRASHFHAYEVTFVCLTVQRLVREAQGQRDNAANWDAVSAPQLPVQAGQLSGLDENDEAESGFFVV